SVRPTPIQMNGTDSAAIVAKKARSSGLSVNNARSVEPGTAYWNGVHSRPNNWVATVRSIRYLRPNKRVPIIKYERRSMVPPHRQSSFHFKFIGPPSRAAIFPDLASHHYAGPEGSQAWARLVVSCRGQNTHLSAFDSQPALGVER